MEQNNKKIITVLFSATAFLAAYILVTIIELLSAISGVVAQYTQGDFAQHILPVGFGILVFLVLLLNKKIMAWADEVVMEIRKVVWRSMSETTQLTVVVCILLLIVGIFLSVVDITSAKIVNYLLTL